MTDQEHLEPLGDPDEAPADFAEEHEDFLTEDVEELDDGEAESPGRYAGGLDREGPP